MKSLILSFLVIQFIGIGKSIAQNFVTSPFICAETELVVHNENGIPLPYWQGNWSRESLAQIEKLIKEYGTPDEITLTSMFWVIQGDIPKTILFTEYYFYFQDSLPKKNSDCYTKNLVWN